jgi:hypothetical protein
MALFSLGMIAPLRSPHVRMKPRADESTKAGEQGGDYGPLSDPLVLAGFERADALRQSWLTIALDGFG